MYDLTYDSYAEVSSAAYSKVVFVIFFILTKYFCRFRCVISIPLDASYRKIYPKQVLWYRLYVYLIAFLISIF